MSQNITIDSVQNGWIVRVYNPELDDDDTAETHVFTDKSELVEWLSETLDED